ncbi:MAG: hypothetical protein ACR2FJ_09270 [Qipengyuania sp.]
MKWVAIIGLTVAAAVVAVPAEAQSRRDNSQIGSRFARKAKTYDEDKVREMQKTVARCVAWRHKEGARKLLQHSDSVGIDFYETEYSSDDWFDQMDVADCIERVMSDAGYYMEMRISYPALRNLLAEEVYLMDNEAPPVIGEGASEQLENRNFATGMNPRAVAFAKLADCIVYHAPATADALARSRPGSGEERDAFKDLRPAIGKCTGTEPNKVDADPSLTRMVVADGLWSRTFYGRAQTQAAAERTE